MIVHGEGLRDYLETKLDARLRPDCQFLGRAKDGVLLGVLGFQDWTFDDVELLWAGDRGFGSRELSRVAWHYVWETLGCVRCTGRIRADNTHSLALAERMGFKREGLLRQAWKGHDVHIVGMLKQECRFYGQ